MRNILIILSFSLALFTACRSKNYVYSNTALNKPFPYDKNWDYKGYNPLQADSAYWTYDPDRKEKVMEEVKEKGNI